MHPIHSESQPSDESTPLLSEHVDLEAIQKKVPLPTTQLAALCISRLTDPIAYSQLFPYINQMLFDLQVTDDVSKIGFYSGLIESTYAASQTLTSYAWAKASDVLGRRPVVLTCAAGIAVVTLPLGFCTSLTQIIILRALAGCFGANLAVFHSILGEITHPSHEAIVYPLYSLAWPFGATIGPLSLLYLVFLFAYFYLEETLPSKRPGVTTDGVNPQSPPLGATDLLSIPMIRVLAVSFFALSFNYIAFDVVTEIGYSLATSAVILAILQLCFMPTLLRTYRASTIYHTSMCCWPLTFFLIPFLHVIARAGYNADTGAVNLEANVMVWSGIALVLTCSHIPVLAYTTNTILVRKHSPCPLSFGACNGLMQVAECVSRMLSPAFISSVFAFSVGNDLLGGYPVWVVVMLSVSSVTCFFSRKLVTMDKDVEV
ncbi:MFS domain-containing protein [Mycena venus]|uniref:MFS domain-containing protein n=1 Tax=Mycena venus TaxID=2733690 RepID=A0A8H6XC98_9AGAR|nr:MFS domain-containing protein [Mycena venus]